MTAFDILILATGVERLAELFVSCANAKWAFARGGREFGRRHYRTMVVLHVGLLVGCLVEYHVRDRAPVIVWPAVGVALACQVLRWWCIAVLGRSWNTRVIVVPGRDLVARGPYRVLRHPNYVAVVVEGIALPLAGLCTITAIVFTLINARLLLAVRIPVEERALGLRR